jgi:hypothetical protein
MAQHELKFGETVTHPLGSKAFEFRNESKEWRAVNVAVLAWQSASVSGSCIATSDPVTSEHSEEKLLDMFEGYLENLELGMDEITGLTLYTELQPCVFAHGHGGSSHDHRSSALPDFLKDYKNATFERRSCASRLKARFTNLELYFTVYSNQQHSKFLSFARRWAALDRIQRAVYEHLVGVVVKEKKNARVHLQCIQEHCSTCDVKPVYDQNAFIEVLNGLTCATCGRNTFVLGCATLK